MPVWWYDDAGEGADDDKDEGEPEVEGWEDNAPGSGFTGTMTRGFAGAL